MLNTYRILQNTLKCILNVEYAFFNNYGKMLSRSYLMPQQWFFARYIQNGPNDELEILFQFLQYRGL